MADYSSIDKTLHRLALGPRPVRELAFDIETALGEVNGEACADQAHVFVCGLARAGTSILLRTLYRDGAFATLSYRDMPFVLAPRLWAKLTGRWRLAATASERPHGDGLDVSFDSPEAFDEVFWLTFAERLYVGDQALRPHAADSELIDHLRDYVAAITLSKGRSRYLSKNNNNILRLKAISEAFPRAHIVIPFREPIAHATSLLRQHERFCRLHAADPFAADYMSWLGHFEFGAHHKAFDFGGFLDKTRGMKATALDFWLLQWSHVYENILERAPKNAIFWNFDAMRKDPEQSIGRLCEVVGVDAPDVSLITGAPERAPAAGREDLLRSATRVYARLAEAAL